jgi:MATE family multidrug resistance protein
MDELRELVALAIPVVTVQVGMMLMGVVDTIMVGHVSPTDLAAVALGNLYFFSATVFGMGTLFALDPIVSQAIGAGDAESLARGLQRGILLAAGLAVLATLLVLPARWVLILFRQPPDVIPVAVGYARMAAPGILPFYVYIVFRQTLQAMGRLAPIVWTIALANLANVGFNWVLVYGNLGAPPLGAMGAGGASSLSRWLMAMGVLAAAWAALRPHLRPFRPQVLRRDALLRMLGLGAPIGAQFSLEFGAFAVTGLLMGWFGTIAMASHQVALNLAALTFMVPVGVSQATAVLVGRAVGRTDTPGARRAAGAGLLTGAAFMTTTALVFLTVPGLLARVYTSDGEVLALAVMLIPIAGVFQVFDGLQVVGSAVLRGIGDTRAPMVIGVLGFWGVGFPVSLWVGFGLGAGAVGLWWGLVAGLGAVAALLLVRIRHRFGRELRRIVIEDELPSPARS